MWFKYFGYGSNLAGHRLSLSCPSLKKHSIGKLLGHSLAFGKYADPWKGGVASVQQSADKEDHAWGVIWDVDISELGALDIQEGVGMGHYQPLEVLVESCSGDQIKCRTYQLTDLGGEQEYTAPSPQYLGVILEGALENNLPSEYITKLKKIETNGNEEITDLMRSVADMKKG